jgi:hypothetical protein
MAASERESDPATPTTSTRSSRRPGGLRIAALALREDHGRMGGGGSGARLTTCSDGQRWVLKSPIFGGQSHPFFCLNEAVGSLVGRRLGVNVPDVAVVEFSQNQLHAYNAQAPSTARFAVAIRLIDPAEAVSPETASLAHRGEVAGLLTHNALISNTDAKEEHVLAYRDDEDDDRWRLAGIDYAHSLAMGPSLSSFDPTTPAPQPLPLLAQRVTAADVAPWVEAARAIRREEFLEIIQVLPGTWVVEPDGCETLADALFKRAQTLDQVVSQHFGAVDTV